MQLLVQGLSCQNVQCMPIEQFISLRYARLACNTMPGFLALTLSTGSSLNEYFQHCCVWEHTERIVVCCQRPQLCTFRVM